MDPPNSGTHLYTHTSHNNNNSTMDPFYEVEADCRQQLSQLEEFVERQQGISTEVIQEYNNQRSDIIETIDDLRQSVESIQLNPQAYSSITPTELAERALKVSLLTEKLNKAGLQWTEKQNLEKKPITTMSNRISQEFDNPDSNYQQFQQQELLREQDQHLDNIHQTMQNLHQQLTIMGDELQDQHVLLRQFEDDIDSVGAKLRNGLKRVDYFLEKNRDKATDCCIFLLILALVVLLFILIVL